MRKSASTSGLEAKFLLAALLFQAALCGRLAATGPEGSFGEPRRIGAAGVATNVSWDGLTVYATHKLDGQYDLYYASRPTTGDVFGELVPFDAFNTPGNEIGASLSDDGLVLYFASGPSGSMDLYEVRRETREHEFLAENSRSLGPDVNSPDSDWTPAISLDGRTLVFTSSWNLFMVTRAATHGPFGNRQAVVAGGAIRDAGPHLSPDGGLILWADVHDQGTGTASKLRTGGLGVGDLWLSQRSATADSFGPPLNLNDYGLGSSVSTNNYDSMAGFSTDWPADGSKIYVAHWHNPTFSVQLYEYPWITHPPEADFAIPEPVAGTQFAADASASFPRGGHSITTYDWDFGDGETATGRTVPHVYERAGLYQLTLTVTDSRGASVSHTERITARCPLAGSAPWVSTYFIAPPLDPKRPDPFAAVPIPYPGAAEFVSEERRMLICAAGSDLSNKEDAFHFLHQERAGDLDFSARLEGLADGSTRAQAGIMLRASLTPDAPYAMMSILRGFTDRVRFQARLTEGTRPVAALGDVVETGAGAWLRLQKQDDECIGYASSDGVEWKEVGRATIPGFPEIFQAGFATVSSGGDEEPFTALRVEFTDVELGGSSLTRFVRGDCDGDTEACSGVNDALVLLNWLFLGAAEPPCRMACDADGSGELELTDAAYGLSFCFFGGTPPLEPFLSGCGLAAAGEDALGCETPPAGCR